jgi:hypothetical protein
MSSWNRFRLDSGGGNQSGNDEPLWAIVRAAKDIVEQCSGGARDDDDEEA